MPAEYRSFKDNFGQALHGPPFAGQGKSRQIRACETQVKVKMPENLAPIFEMPLKRLIDVRPSRLVEFTPTKVVSGPNPRCSALLRAVQIDRAYRITATILHTRAPTTFNSAIDCVGCHKGDSRARGPFQTCVAMAGAFDSACTNVCP